MSWHLQAFGADTVLSLCSYFIGSQGPKVGKEANV